MAAFFTENSKLQACETNYYYDKNVRRCSPCEDICNNAQLQRTERMCLLQCPHFLDGSAKKELANSLSPAVISVIIIIVLLVVVAAIVIRIKRETVRDTLCRLANRCQRNTIRQEAEVNTRDEEETELKEINVFMDNPSRRTQAAPNDEAVVVADEEVKSMIPVTDSSSPDYSKRDKHQIVCS